MALSPGACVQTYLRKTTKTVVRQEILDQSRVNGVYPVAKIQRAKMSTEPAFRQTQAILPTKTFALTGKAATIATVIFDIIAVAVDRRKDWSLPTVP